MPPQEFGQLAASRLLTHQQPFEVLASWRDSGIRLPTCAWVVARALRGPRPGRASRALAGLADRGRVVTTSLCRRRPALRWEPQADDRDYWAPPPAPGGRVLPPTLETGPLPEEMAAAVFDLAYSRGATTACVAALACDVLVWGQTEHRELLGLLTSELSPAWRDFCGRVESFGSAPLPLSGLTATRTEPRRSAAWRREERRSSPRSTGSRRCVTASASTPGPPCTARCSGKAASCSGSCAAARAGTAERQGAGTAPAARRPA